MKNVFGFLTLAIFFTGLSSCLKENYDAPPTGGKDPDIEATITIKDLKNLYSGTPFQITDDFVIRATITADDKSGNFYKTLVLEDSTGGIAIRMDGTDLYTAYPIGRRVFVKCKGLWLGDYANLVQLGGYINAEGDLDAIPYTLFESHILKGVYGLPVVPKAVTILQLNDSYQNMLIELNDVEFATADAGQTYADAVTKYSLNRTLKNCTGGSILVRSSGYSSFAGKLTPTGKGKFVGIYTVFNSTAQLVIRDPSDLKMDSVRCGGGVVVNGNGIMGIRGLWTGSDVTKIGRAHV